jgi:hypothetical protein
LKKDLEEATSGAENWTQCWKESAQWMETLKKDLEEAM